MVEYKIYYIGKKKINWNKTNDIGYIFENLIYELDNFVKFVRFVFDKASIDSSTNFLIYCEDLTKEHCHYLSNILDIYSIAGKIFMNITIYNKTINSHLSIERIDGYKKIVNIFPFDHTIKICDQTVYDTVISINKTISVLFDPTKPSDECFTIYYEKKNKQSGGNINTRLFDFRIMETNDSVELESTWWFKYYFSIPLCAFGRLAQSAGTCWLNVCLNILFLSEPIAKLLITKYNGLDKDLKTQIEQIKRPYYILASNASLQVILWSLVNMFLIHSSKAITLDSNFILVIGSKIKSLCEFGNENYYIENNFVAEYAESFNTYSAFIMLCNIYFESEIDFFSLYIKSGLLFEQRKIMRELYDKYNHLKFNLNDSNFDEFDKLGKQINMYDDLDYKSYLIVKEMDQLNKQIILNWDELILPNTKISPSNPPKILIIPTITTTKIHQIIYVGETEYKLIAAGINFYIKEHEVSHIISGLFCRSKYYIYDSNNIISYSNWNQEVYNDYIDQLNEIYQVNGYSYEYQNNFIIYIQV